MFVDEFSFALMVSKLAGHGIARARHSSRFHHLLQSVQICRHFLGGKFSNQSECYATQTKWRSNNSLAHLRPGKAKSNGWVGFNQLDNEVARGRGPGWSGTYNGDVRLSRSLGSSSKRHGT
jgi:hypothetical protein